jgi:hypothetical protein
MDCPLPSADLSANASQTSQFDPAAFFLRPKDFSLALTVVSWVSLFKAQWVALFISSKKGRGLTCADRNLDAEVPQP